jgi:hypothetical protein
MLIFPGMLLPEKILLRYSLSDLLFSESLLYALRHGVPNCHRAGRSATGPSQLPVMLAS